MWKKIINSGGMRDPKFNSSRRTPTRTQGCQPGRSKKTTQEDLTRWISSSKINIKTNWNSIIFYVEILMKKLFQFAKQVETCTASSNLSWWKISWNFNIGSFFFSLIVETNFLISSMDKMFDFQPESLLGHEFESLSCIKFSFIHKLLPCWESYSRIVMMGWKRE